MSTAQTLITAEEFAQMDFEHPVELVRGEIIHMPPADQAHGAQCANVIFALKTWVRRTGQGQVTANDSGVITERDPDTVRGADVCYFRPERLPADGRFHRGEIDLVPNLCVEVLSPSNRPSEMQRKVAEFFARGVEEVWFVDLARRDLQVFLPDEEPRTLDETETVSSRHLPGFACPVADFFEGV